MSIMRSYQKKRREEERIEGKMEGRRKGERGREEKKIGRTRIRVLDVLVAHSLTHSFQLFMYY